MIIQGVLAVELDVEGRRQHGAADVGSRLAQSQLETAGKNVLKTGLASSFLASTANSFSN